VTNSRSSNQKDKISAFNYLFGLTDNYDISKMDFPLIVVDQNGLELINAKGEYTSVNGLEFKIIIELKSGDYSKKLEANIKISSARDELEIEVRKFTRLLENDEQNIRVSRNTYRKSVFLEYRNSLEIFKLLTTLGNDNSILVNQYLVYENIRFSDED
jgi:hypothetical protein